MVTVDGSWPMGKENDHYVDLVSWISGHTHNRSPRKTCVNWMVTREV